MGFRVSISILIWIPGKASLASRDLFFNLFEVCPASKGVIGHGLVSLSRIQNRVFKLYINSLKKFKFDYFLATLLTLPNHDEFCVISSTPSSLPTAQRSINNFGLWNTSLNVPRVIGAHMMPLMPLIRIWRQSWFHFLMIWYHIRRWQWLALWMSGKGCLVSHLLCCLGEYDDLFNLYFFISSFQITIRKTRTR